MIRAAISPYSDVKCGMVREIGVVCQCASVKKSLVKRGPREPRGEADRSAEDHQSILEVECCVIVRDGWPIIVKVEKIKDKKNESIRFVPWPP